jgi:hypothetical protein
MLVLVKMQDLINCTKDLVSPLYIHQLWLGPKETTTAHQRSATTKLHKRINHQVVRASQVVVLGQVTP